MQKIYTLITSIIFILSISNGIAQTIWTGPPITFTKNALADWTLAENQDRLTDSVWITRANNSGLFNIAKETEFEGNGNEPANFGASPIGTEWAFGSTSEGVENLSFMNWINATTSSTGNAAPPTLVGESMVLHLIAEDIYLDITLLSWGQGNNGGGSFSYERATGEITSISELGNQKESLTVFPNPASDYLVIQDLELAQKVEILDMLGSRIQQRFVHPNEQINTINLSVGVYYIRTDDGRIARFVKQ